MEQKMELIRAEEQRFAEALSFKVIDRPRPKLWMILMPVLFVYYFQQQSRYRDGRNAFVAHYLFSRGRVLEEAAASVAEGRPPDIDALVAGADIPAEARGEYSAFTGVLAEHYIDLLTADGRSFGDLARGAYRTRINFLLFSNRLNRVERALNAAVRSRINEPDAVLTRIIDAMERYSEMLRRRIAERIFA